MKYWLTKSEPETFSIDDLAREKKTLWDGVRNYLARNYLREMAVGDEVLFYHSNTEPAGIVGIAKVTKSAVADPTQFQKKSEYFDEKATKENPRWFSPELSFSRKFTEILSLQELRELPELGKLEILKKGTRLSVTPVTAAEFRIIQKLRT